MIKNGGYSPMTFLTLVGIFIGAVLLFISFSMFFENRASKKETEKPALAPPVAPVESQEAINARVKMSAEIASALSRIEELERENNALRNIQKSTAQEFKNALLKTDESVSSLNGRVSYQSGAVDSIKAQLKTLTEKPELKIPRTFRLNMVHYEGKEVERAKRARLAREKLKLQQEKQQQEEKK